MQAMVEQARRPSPTGGAPIKVLAPPGLRTLPNSGPCCFGVPSLAFSSLTTLNSTCMGTPLQQFACYPPGLFGCSLHQRAAKGQMRQPQPQPQPPVPPLSRLVVHRRSSSAARFGAEAGLGPAAVRALSAARGVEIAGAVDSDPNVSEQDLGQVKKIQAICCSLEQYSAENVTCFFIFFPLMLWSAGCGRPRMNGTVLGMSRWAPFFFFCPHL